MSVRLVAVVMVVALVAGGPLAQLAAAQQPAQTDEPPAAAVSEGRIVRRGADAYDVGAVAMTLAGAPLKLVVCALSGVLGVTLFFITFGTADRATAAVVREGCGQKWIVRGDDIRPDVSR